MTLNWIGVASINLAIAVALGAFGAHGLKAVANSEQLAWWHTGTQYFFWHALGLLILGILIRHFGYSSVPAWLMQIGVVIFAGSLYAMALGAPRWFGAITPIGGVLMIVAWLWLASVAFRQGAL